MSNKNMSNKNMSNKKNIYISVSQLYIVLGLDKFGNLCPLLTKLWKNVAPKDYFRIIYDIQDIYSLDHLYENTYQSIERISRKTKIDIIPDVEKCLRKKNTKDLVSYRNQMIEKINADPRLDTSTKQELINHIRNLTNTNFGTSQENSAVNLYCQKRNVEVFDCQKFIKKKVAQTNTHDWYLCGKIDGISTEGVLIEIKNRIHKLFGILRDYEKPQIQTYLKMTNLKRGHLVECLKNKKSNMNIIEVERDNIYWKQFILPRVEKFINFFYKILKKRKIKIMILLREEEKIGRLFKNFISNT